MSLSASAENLSTKSQGYDGSTNMCLELALEGERLCKSGDCQAGVAFFQAAIQAGTDDLRTLSAIYSQLGNAFFYLGDYVRALQYHSHDLILAKTMDDKLGEAKSSGNLGNTLKVMGRFEEAILYCEKHLLLSRDLNDKLSEGRALYNLGNVYHAKGKHIGRFGNNDQNEFSDDIKQCLQQAISHYEENLELMRELGDIAAQGRACGNLGNTHYLLGEFEEAIKYHEERLSIARQFGDRAAERRAHSNLGNSQIFMGKFDKAAFHYEKTLSLAQELGDKALEAQACYSLGNTYTLLRDYSTAIDYHLRHLLIAQHLKDRIGEGRACWSLGNAYAALSNHEKALEYAILHLQISNELQDVTGIATAKMNIADLKTVLNIPETIESENNDLSTIIADRTSESSHNLIRVRRESMEQLDLIKMTPDGKRSLSVINASDGTGDKKTDDDDSFFDLLTRFQSKRMDDQRCNLSAQNNKENSNPVIPAFAANSNKDGPEDLLDLIVGMQSKRMEEQRATLPSLPGLQTYSLQQLDELRCATDSVPDENFLERLARCQSSRLNDQRSLLPTTPAVDIESDLQPTPRRGGATTIPDEDFFSLIMRFQSSGRMEDQRAPVPRPLNRIANGTIPNNAHLPQSNNKKKKKPTN